MIAEAWVTAVAQVQSLPHAARVAKNKNKTKPKKTLQIINEG